MNRIFVLIYYHAQKDKITMLKQAKYKINIKKNYVYNLKVIKSLSKYKYS